MASARGCLHRPGYSRPPEEEKKRGHPLMGLKSRDKTLPEQKKTFLKEIRGHHTGFIKG